MVWYCDSKAAIGVFPTCTNKIIANSKLIIDFIVYLLAGNTFISLVIKQTITEFNYLCQNSTQEQLPASHWTQLK